MARSESALSRSALARLGFADLTSGAAAVEELSDLVGVDGALLLNGAAAADPDTAAEGMLRVARREATTLRQLLGDPETRSIVWRVFGASAGLADFFLRHPDQLSVLSDVGPLVPSAVTLRERMLDAVGAVDGVA